MLQFHRHTDTDMLAQQRRHDPTSTRKILQTTRKTEVLHIACCITFICSHFSDAFKF